MLGPMSNPYFNAGVIIGGERFLGRKRQIRRIQERLLGDRGYASAAVIGLPKIGKSSLVQKAILDDADELAKARKIIAVRLEVGTMNSFGHLLTDLVRETTGKLIEFGHITEAIQRQSAEALEAGPNQQWYEVHTFFRLLKKAGIRVICVLDEFDAGRYTLKDNPQSFHALRELASSTEFKIGLVLVSKRDLGEICRQAGHPSDYWANVLKVLDLGPFAEDDLEEYFASLANAGIVCNPALRAEIVRLSGAHPFILDQAACEAWAATSEKEKFTALQWSATIGRLPPNLLRQIVGVLQDGPGLEKLCHIIFQRGINQSKEDIESFIRYGLIVRAANGKLRPFAPSLPEFLRDGVNEATFGNITARQPTSPLREDPGPTKLQGPFQLDCSEGKLRAANGRQTARIPSKFLLVLEAMLKTESGRYGSLKTLLSYTEVAAHYTKGLVQDTPSEEDDERKKLKQAIADSEEDPYLKKKAQQFKRGFAVWLKRWNIAIKDVVLCDRHDGAYRMGHSWDDPPTFYASEASLFTTDHKTLERLAAPKTGKTKIHSPDCDHAED